MLLESNKQESNKHDILKIVIEKKGIEWKVEKHALFSFYSLLRIDERQENTKKKENITTHLITQTLKSIVNA